MKKFCQYCGKELNLDQDVCLGCGKTVTPATQTVAPVAKPTIKHNGYYISTSIIMIIMAASMVITGFNAETIAEYELIYDNLSMVFTLPGLLGLAGAIVCLVGKKNKKMLIASGICYIAGAVVNFIAISDISIFTIMAAILASFNIVFASKMD